MSLDHAARPYDLVLYGASGYTGKLTAEYIIKNAPTNFKWAIAGRNEKKLLDVIKELKELDPNRPLPEIEIADLQKSSQDALAKKARLIITTVGPYHRYGTPVLAACAENGTHYIDCTGEPPWVKDMIDRYHSVAEKSGAVMIPQCGIDSVPADIISYLLVKEIRDTLDTGVKEVILSQHRFNMGPSGGTIETALTIADTYEFKKILAAMKPFALSPVPHPNPRGPPRPLLEKITGVRSIPSLGVQTDALQNAMDRAIVGRSWGLYDKGKYYGEKFHFIESKRTRNIFTGAVFHFGYLLVTLALAFGPVRTLVRRFLYQPGDGPEIKSTHSDELTYRAAAYPDLPDDKPPRRAIADFTWIGSGYYLTGLLVFEAALLILNDKQPKGGIVTPATLGEEYAERIRKAGVKLEIRMEK